jgi:exodeoxyribonuclease-3
MRLVSWNVNGIRALERKGLLPWNVITGVDVLALQETKASQGQLSPWVGEPEGWHVVWAAAQRAGYSGTALLSRQKPDEIKEGMGEEAFDSEGRVCAMRLGQIWVVSAYFPNSQEAGARLEYKLAFCAAMERFLARLRKDGCGTVLLGDYNIAHKPIDLTHPEANEDAPGYLPQERAWMDRYLSLGYRDVWRERNPSTIGYSWWSYRSGARARNVGWRIDYATVSPDLADQVTGATIHPEIEGSDHCPVSVDVTQLR